MTRWTDDHFVAGDIALDFANTVYRRIPELGPDLLDSGAALAGWFTHTDLLPSIGDGGDAALQQARTLRGLLWALFDAQIEGRDVPLGELLDMARRGASVAATGHVTALTVEGAVAAVALHGVRVALSPPPRAVRTCDRCGWYFLDSARGRPRRWCSMKTCGNQAKAERYRAAHT